jgi:hypothetical protein
MVEQVAANWAKDILQGLKPVGFTGFTPGLEAPAS